MGKHSAPSTTVLSTTGPDEFEVEEITEILRDGLLPDGDKLGDGGADDWKLSILALLANRGFEDGHEYVAPRLVRAAEILCDEIGFGTHGYVM